MARTAAVDPAAVGDVVTSAPPSTRRAHVSRRERRAFGPVATELRRAGMTALLLLAMLNVADVVLTRLLVSRGGIELNPVADRLLESSATLVVKLGLVVVLAVHFLRRGPRLSVVCFMWLVAGIYTVVVVINGSQLVAVWG